MLLSIPIIVMLVTAFALAIILIFRPKFKFAWLIAAGGAALSLIAVLLWQINMPQIFSLFTWQPELIFVHTPEWLGDGFSWTYALSLAALSLTVILTSVARNELNLPSWAGTLVLCAAGIASVTAGNPLTLVLVWAALDLTELVVMLRSTEGGAQSESVVIAFSTRLSGIGLVLWASAAAGPWTDFRSAPAQSGIFLLLAAGLRLGILPLHLPYRQENILRRGFGTTLRLVSAASSLALLARIPPSTVTSRWTPVLLILVAIAGLYAGWKWLRASDELTGRPFWVLGMASLAVAAALRGNPAGSAAWGNGLVLGGGILFLYSARQRNILWMLFLMAVELAALPFSLTATGWQSGTSFSPLLVIISLPTHAFLLAGFVRHALHPGESSLESQPRWVQAIYPLGLFILPAISILISLWGWDGARQLGAWWAMLVVLFLTAGLMALVLTVMQRLLDHSGGTANPWTEILHLTGLFRSFWAIYRFLGRISDIITGALEGDGGILWSFLLLALLLSVFASLR
jgi:hypothetical protein